MADGILFLDRDGVLNEKEPEGRYITGPAGIRVIEGVGEAIATLREQVPGLRIAVVTNQRGIATGRTTLESVDQANAYLLAELSLVGATIDRVEVCPHDEGVCDCRKPGTGLLERVLASWPDASASASALVGDSASDIIAGARFGVRTYLIGDPDRRTVEAAMAAAAGAAPNEQANNLIELARSGRLTRWLGDGTEAESY